MGVMYKGVGWCDEGRGGWGGWVGRQAEGGLSLPLGYRQQCCVLSRWQRSAQSTAEIKKHIGSFGNPSILISATQWLYKPCNAPTQFLLGWQKAICKSRPGYL